MTEQQQHLQNLLEQRASLEQQISQNKELFLKVQGAIEYLTQIGVILPEQKIDKKIDSEENIEE